LIAARTDTHLWAEHYDRQIADVFAIQSEIAQQIADQLRAKISPEEKAAMTERPTADLQAYALYSEAKTIFGWGNWAGADKELARKVALLEKAIRRDSKFALAYCALAEAHDNLYWLTDDRKHLELAKNAADTALRLRPDLGQPHLELARYYYTAGNAGDFDHAYEELTIARRTLPNDSGALYIAGKIDRHRNRWSDSVAELQRASELDPNNPEPSFHLLQNYRLMRRYDLWKQLLQKNAGQRENAWDQLNLAQLKLDTGDPAGAQAVLAQIPQDFSPTANIWSLRFTVALYLRDYDAASRVIAATPAKFAEDNFGGQSPQSTADGWIARLRGDNEKAQAIFLEGRKRFDAKWRNEVKDQNYFVQAATFDAALGRKNEAIAEARQAVELLPIAKDSLLGPRVVANLAQVYASTGEKDRAIEQLEIVAKIPAGPTYGELKYDPDWGNLRGDPRFEKIVASLTPKDGDSK
jgi:tetratricopeptide (TPR) repeat protein